MHPQNIPVWRRVLGRAPRVLVAAAGTVVLSCCGVATDADGAGDGPLDTEATERLLRNIADRAPDGLTLDLPTCPVLEAEDVEQAAPDTISLPPLTQPWVGGLTEDFTAMIGQAAGVDLGAGRNPTVSCWGTWGSESSGGSESVDVLVLINLRDTDPPEEADAFRGGRLHTECPDDTSCTAVWQRGQLGVTVNLSGTVPLADGVDDWVAGLVPDVLDGAAGFNMDAVLPPPPPGAPAYSYPAPTASVPPVPTSAPAPVVPDGADCESRLIAAIANYAIGAASIDSVLRTVPSAVAVDAQRVAEDIRSWVATDPAAAQMAGETPALLFGSGAVIGSLCAGA